MSYLGLGSRTVQGESNDNLHWTLTFDPAALSVSTTIPYFEVYKLVVTDVIAGALFIVNIESWAWDAGIFGQFNAWDPNQPALLKPGQTLSINITYTEPNSTPPQATAWLRYDASLLKVM